ncbi:MAG: extracellular solute-binding protein [Acidobacteriota bacterium]|nr:extracellular solute-binding protein [Acidobacteriota bacterium]
MSGSVPASRPQSEKNASRHVHPNGFRIALILGLALAGSPWQAAPESIAAPTRVYMARDLEPLFRAPLAEFSRRRPERTVEIVARPGSAMRKELAAGRSTGILIASGATELVSLDQAGRLAPGSAIRLADVPLGVFVRAASAVKNLSDLKALAGPGFARVGIAARASGAIGAESEQALHKAGIWEAVRPKLVVLPPEDLIAAAARGDVDASVAALNQAEAAVRAALIIPDRLHDPLTMTAVLLRDTPADAGTRAVTDFLRSPEIRDVLLKAGGRLPAPDRPAAGELFFYCGAGLREAADDLIAEFGKATGIRVRPTYTGSGCLLAQITISESGDLYMPGEQFYMDQAVGRGFIREREVVTYFIPVIMVGKGNPRHIHGLTDLFRPGLRLGIGEKDSTAIGAFTPKLLAAEKLSYEALLKNVVASFATAPEMGNAVKLGAVDAAIQWDAVASWYLDGADVVAFPTDPATISPVPLGVLKFSRDPAAARSFLKFALSPVGRAIFEKHGHSIDPSRPTFRPKS